MTGRKTSNPIPDFDDNGNLPPRIYKVTLDDIREVFTGSERRKQLFEGLEKVIVNFRSAGIKEVFIDGSFTTIKDEPNDIDGFWIFNNDVDIDVLDPVFLDTDPPRQRMKNEYGVDFLFGHVDMEAVVQSILAFFMRDRDYNPKGILSLDI